MERYTPKDESGVAYIKNFYKHTHGLQASENLAAYEDTNLTHTEIEALKAKLQKVEEEREAAVKLLYSMPIANKRVEEIRHDILKILEDITCD